MLVRIGSSTVAVAVALSSFIVDVVAERMRRRWPCDEMKIGVGVKASHENALYRRRMLQIEIEIEIAVLIVDV